MPPTTHLLPLARRNLLVRNSFLIRPRSYPQPPKFRLQSTSSSSPSTSNTSQAAIGALSGALAAVSVGYIFYRTSGTRELVVASKKTSDYLNAASRKIKESAPEPNQAIEWLRDAALSYASFIPGAKGYVEAAFRDLDTVREKHGDEVDRIVREATGELKKVVGEGDVSVFTAQEAWGVIVKYMGQVAELSRDVVGEILENHPEIKEKVGGNVDALREMGDKYGPEAKKEVERTWDQVAEIVKGGFSAANVEKVRKLVQEKMEKMREFADKAWQKGMEQAKPYLDKNPQVKKLVEENKDALQSGNLQELWEKVKTAVQSGDTGDLEKYVKQAADKAKEKTGGKFDVDKARKYAEQFMGKIPGGDQIVPKLEQLQDAASKHGDEAQKLFKDAVKEVGEVLEKYAEKSKGLADEAKKDAKK